MKKISILLAFICTVSTLQSQITQSEYRSLASTIPNEKTELSVNSTILLSGEYLYYQVYTLNLKTNVYSEISKVLYVEMLNANKEQVFKQKLKVSDNVASGEFFFPAGLESGHYKLIAYTNWTKNNSKESYDQIDVFIVNPFTKETQFRSVSDSTKLNTLSYSDSLSVQKKSNQTNSNLKLALKNNVFKTREAITLAISNSNLQETVGQYSVSVRKVDPVSLSKEVIKSAANRADINTYYLPELRGEIISGTILNTLDNSPLSNKTVSLSFPEQNFVLKTAQTNNLGKFYFNLDKNYNTETAIIQVVDVKGDSYSVNLDKQEVSAYGELNFVPLALDETIKEWLERRSIETQIENSYFEIKADSIIATSENQVFFGNTGITYKLDNYTRFPTLRQTFTEVVAEAYISKENDSVQFHTLDLINLEFNRNFSYLKPLVLIDGIYITNNEDIIDYSANRIESITVIPGTYLYGPQLHNGVISMLTINRDFTLPNATEVNSLEINSPVSNKIYYQPDYTNDRMKNIPDYRTQLLWQPNTELTKSNTEFEFYTSDTKGTFKVTLEGYSKNGMYTSNSLYFEVE